MGKETSQVTYEGQLRDSSRPDVNLFSKSDIVFSRGILPKVFEIASFPIFTAIASGKKRHRQVLTKYTVHEPLLDKKTLERLERASIEHDFLFEAALHARPGKDRNRNEVIIWLRQHGVVQEEVANIFKITSGRVSQIEKSHGARIGTVKTSADRIIKELDEIGQERIDEMIKRIAEAPEFRDKKYTVLKTREVLKELGLPYGNSNLNARRIRYLEKKYQFPKSKAELLFRAKYPHLKDFRRWLTQLYVEQSIPAEKIAVLLGVSPSTLGSEFSRLGITNKLIFGVKKRRKPKLGGYDKTIVKPTSTRKEVGNVTTVKSLPKSVDAISESRLQRKSLTGRRAKAINQLPEIEKVVMTYYLDSDFSIEEIAYAIGKDKKSVERLLRRAQSHLKKILEGK